MNYKFDAVDLIFGQYLRIYQRLQTRLFTGLRYARLDSNMSTSCFTNWLNGPNSYTYGSFNGEVNSSFNGLGPMIGMRANFDIGHGFDLSGVFDSALLVGQLSFDASQNITETNSGLMITKSLA